MHVLSCLKSKDGSAEGFLSKFQEQKPIAKEADDCRRAEFTDKVPTILFIVITKAILGANAAATHSVCTIGATCPNSFVCFWPTAPSSLTPSRSTGGISGNLQKTTSVFTQKSCKLIILRHHKRVNTILLNFPNILTCGLKPPPSF